MGGQAKVAAQSLDDLLDSIRSEKRAGSPGDGTEQRNRDGVPGGTDHVSGSPAVTSEDNLKPKEEGSRSQENSDDVAASYPNSVESQPAATWEEKGNLSQEPMAVTTEEAPKQDGNPKDKKDDSPTSHPASTEKIEKDGGDLLSKIASAIAGIDKESTRLAKEAGVLDMVEAANGGEEAEEGEEEEEEGEEKEEAGEEKEEEGEEGMSEKEAKFAALLKEASEKHPELFEKGAAAGDNAMAEQLVKAAAEAYPEEFKQGLMHGEQFSQDFIAGAKQANADLESLTTDGIAETVKKASDDADVVGQYLLGIMHGQKKANEDAEAALTAQALADDAAAAAPEAVIAPEAAMGEVGPEDAGDLSAAIDEAISGLETGGPVSEDEVIAALTDALAEEGADDEMAAAISEQEKAAVAAAESGKLKKAIKKAAIRRYLTPKVKQAMAKKAAARSTRKEK